MDVRSQLNEYLQGSLRESPRVRLATSYIDSKYVVTLWIWAQKWTSEPYASLKQAKLAVLQNSLSELKTYKTEKALRQRLRLVQVSRNSHIEAIRMSCRELKRSFKEMERRELIGLLAKIYPIINDLELRMQGPGWCENQYKG